MPPSNAEDPASATALDQFLQWGSGDMAAALAPITVGSAAHLQHLSPGQSQECSPEKVPMHHTHGHPQAPLPHVPSLRGPPKHPHLAPQPPTQAPLLANQLGKLRVGGGAGGGSSGASSASATTSSSSSQEYLSIKAQGARMLLPGLQGSGSLAHAPLHPEAPLSPRCHPTPALSAANGQAPGAKLKLAASGGSSSSRKAPVLRNNSSGSSSSSSSSSGSSGAPSLKALGPDCGRQQQWPDAAAKHDDYYSSSSTDSSTSPGDSEAAPGGYQPALSGAPGRLQAPSGEAAAGYQWRPCGLPFPLKAGTAAMLHR